MTELNFNQIKRLKDGSLYLPEHFTGADLKRFKREEKKQLLTKKRKELKNAKIQSV